METEKTEELIATNYSLSQTLNCLVDLYEKLEEPTGNILYAINKNKTKLIANGKEVNSTRETLLALHTKCGEDGKPEVKKQGGKDENGNEVETVVWVEKDSEKKFMEAYQSLMNAENKDFIFHKIPLSVWNEIKIKKGEPVYGIDYLFEYIIDEEK